MKRGAHGLISGTLMEFALKTEETIQNAGQGSQILRFRFKTGIPLQVGNVIASVILLDGA